MEEWERPTMHGGARAAYLDAACPFLTQDDFAMYSDGSEKKLSQCCFSAQARSFGTPSITSQWTPCSAPGRLARDATFSSGLADASNHASNKWNVQQLLLARQAWYSQIAFCNYGLVGVDVRSHQPGEPIPMRIIVAGNEAQDQACNSATK